MLIYLGSDHAGFNLKKVLKDYLTEKLQGEDDKVLDLGVFTNDATDYPDIAREVCEKVVENPGTSMGILICGSGVGMSISANRVNGIRAVLANNEETARLARAHNDANILCLGGRMTADEMAKAIVDTFLNTKFDGDERHVRRLEKIETVMKAANDDDGTKGASPDVK